MAYSKRVKSLNTLIDKTKSYPLDKAIEILQSAATGEKTKVKFDQSFDLAVKLGIDPRKSDQTVRGATTLPHGTGKSIRVAVFAQGDKASAAEQAGADIVGFEDLAASIKEGKMDFDVLIATPDAMPHIGKLGQILGPKGLMPNPKVGTVTANPAEAVKNAKAGQARFRADKGGIIHCSIGKANFTAVALTDNLNALIADLKKAKPKAAKGVYFKRICLSTTMGPGITVDPSTVTAVSA